MLKHLVPDMHVHVHDVCGRKLFFAIALVDNIMYMYSIHVNLSYCVCIHSASERVSVVSEYQSRQKAAMDNKRRAEGKGGVKYQPPHGRGQPHPPPMKNKAEQVKCCEFTMYMYVLIFLCVS